MLFQENLEFFSKWYGPVVLTLPLNVFDRIVYARNADAERTIAFLPFKIPILLEGVMNPLGRVSLLHCLGHRNRGWNREK